jgi:hypothetical protein
VVRKFLMVLLKNTLNLNIIKLENLIPEMFPQMTSLSVNISVERLAI